MIRRCSTLTASGNGTARTDTDPPDSPVAFDPACWAWLGWSTFLPAFVLPCLMFCEFRAAASLFALAESETPEDTELELGDDSGDCAAGSVDEFRPEVEPEPTELELCHELSGELEFVALPDSLLE